MFSIVDDLCCAPFSGIFLKQSGLEELLAQQLPLDLIRSALTSAPHSRVSLIDTSRVVALGESAARQQFCDFMIGNKGSAQLHEWLISQLDDQTMPVALKQIVDLVSLLVSGQIPSCRISLM